MVKNLLSSRLFLMFFILTSASIIFTSCDVKNPLMPSWDVEFNIPFVNRTYTIKEIVEKDLQNLRFEGDTALIYYTDEKNNTTITVGNDIIFEPAASSVSETLGSLKVNAINPITDSVDVTKWANVNKGQNQIFPPVVNATVIQDLKKITSFEVAEFESGTLNFALTNNNGPVPITIERIIIRSSKSYSFGAVNIPANTPLLFRTTPLNVPANSTGNASFDLAGVRLVDSLRLEVTFSSPGSGGQSVFVPQNAHTLTTITLGTFALTAVKAALPAQNPVVKNNEVQIDDSTQYKNIEFSQGALNITLQNFIDLSASVKLELPNFKRPNGTAWDSTVTLPRKGTATLSIPNLSGYKATSAALTNKVSYKVTVTPQADATVRLITKNDSIKSTFSFANINVTKIEGKVKPTTLKVKETPININLRDLQGSNFFFQQLNLKDTDIRIYLNESTTFEVFFSGKLIGKNARNQTREMSLPSKLLVKGENEIILPADSIQNFLSGFTQELPNQLTVIGNTRLNPNYKEGSVASTDSVYGKTKLNIPFYVGIFGGSWSDTSSVDIGNADSSRIANGKSAEITFTVENGLPASVEVSAKFLDSKGVELFSTDGLVTSTSGKFLIGGATTDANGRVVEAKKDSIKIKLTTNEFLKVTKATRIVPTIKINTSRSNNQPVKFFTSDAIKIRAVGQINYKLDLEDN
ncbi:MAG: hypothetical protein L6Q59_15595 [Ignavibacteriaceae bacterium]|nr:hypothetical protein [Ignavibacteriaceae bacterium]